MNKTELKELIAGKKCVVMDLDGTVYLGEQPIQESIDFINEYMGSKQFYFMTNNTSHTPFEYVEKLKKFGLDINVHQIITPLIQAVEIIKENKFKTVFLLANMEVTEYFKQSLKSTKFTSDFVQSEALVVAYDTELTYEKLKNTALVLQNYPVRYIATHCDKVCPTEKGMIPDVGSFTDMLYTATNRYPDITLGKPDPEMVASLIADFKKEEVLVIGDRLYTDRKLADNLAVDFLLVLTGETKKIDLENSTDKILFVDKL